MVDTIQVVRVEDGVECELARSRPLVEGGPYEIIVISDVPADSVSMHNKLVLAPIGDVIELTEEAEEFDDENDRWLKMFSTPIESGPDGV